MISEKEFRQNVPFILGTPSGFFEVVEALTCYRLIEYKGNHETDKSYKWLAFCGVYLYYSYIVHTIHIYNLKKTSVSISKNSKLFTLQPSVKTGSHYKKPCKIL